jgi:outer membrane protein assembly factor BamB
VQAGGDKRPLIALEAASGRLLWSQAHSKGATYASPLLGTLGESSRWSCSATTRSTPSGQRTGACSGAFLPADRAKPAGRRFCSPTTGCSCLSWEEVRLVKVSAKNGAFSAAEVWRSPRLKASWSPTVFHRGHLFGLNAGYLVCLDPESGDARWRQKVYPGSLILVDGHLVILGEQSGDVRVAEASPEGYRDKLRVPVFNAGATSMTGPTFAGGRLFLRNVEEIVALEVP